MKTLWVLLAIAILVIVMGMREGFTASGPVPPPYANSMDEPYPRAQMRAVYDRLPQSMRDAQVNKDTQQRIGGGGFMPAEQAINTLLDNTARAAIRVYNETYKSAARPLTDANIDEYMGGVHYAALSQEALNAMTQMLKIMFVGKPIPPPSTSSGTVSDWQAGIAVPPQNTTPPPNPADNKPGESVLARTRPGTGDPKLRQTVATYAGIPLNDPLVNKMISQVQTFYDRVYVPTGKKMPSQADIKSFVDSATDIPPERRPALTSAIDYWFTEPAPPGDSRIESTPGTAGSPAGATPPAAGGWTSKGVVSTGRVWGPPFSGLGSPRDLSGPGGGVGGAGYPSLLGPPPEGSKYWSDAEKAAEKDKLPSSPSLGTDPLSAFLPFSRQPGDMDLVPDPYRVSQTYSPSSYSSKNEPVPFLTDFSAFQK